MNKFSYSTKELANIVGNLDINQFYNKNEIANIGISGASGFLGMHLIQKLVAIKNIKKIKCFIRSEKVFKERKELFKLEFNEDKLEFCFEINSENTKDLDIFIHSAAQVHNIKNLGGLYKDNVELTKKVVKEVACPILYISTLSIYASSNQFGNHLPISCNASEEHLLYGGYAQSKWIGEYLVEQRSDSRIVRFGLLTPSNEQPILQENEFFSLFLKLLKDFPYYPENFEESFIDISPINLASDELVSAIFSENKYTHIANSKATSIKEFVKALELKPVSFDIWNEYINRLKKSEKILLSYAYFKSESLKSHPNYFNIDLFQTTGHNWNGKIKLDNIHNYIKKAYEKI